DDRLRGSDVQLNCIGDVLAMEGRVADDVDLVLLDDQRTLQGIGEVAEIDLDRKVREARSHGSELCNNGGSQDCTVVCYAVIDGAEVLSCDTHCHLAEILSNCYYRRPYVRRHTAPLDLQTSSRTLSPIMFACRKATLPPTTAWKHSGARSRPLK